jgi:hypothetical protein
MITTTRLMFWNVHKKVAEDHNFVGTIGNTILDSGVTVYLQRVTMFLIIHGTMQT